MKKLKFYLISLALTSFCCNSDETEIKTKSNSVQDKQILMCTTDFMNTQNNDTSKSTATMDRWKWRTGQTIKIKFLDGDNDLYEKVKRIASEWTKYANLKFEYVGKNEYADIRIGFLLTGDDNRYGGWSVIGAGTAYSSQAKQTMRLGSLDGDEASSRRTVLHEFGHALGLHHETTNPAANIKWNLPKAYAWYTSNNGWSKEEVDTYVFNKAPVNDYSEYDPLSVMHYYIPASITTNGIGVEEQTELSQIDMKSINKWYPFPIVSILESGQSINDLPWDKRIKSPNGRYSLEFDLGLLKVIDLAEGKAIWEVGNSSYRRKPSCYFESTTGNIIIKGAQLSTLPTTITWTSNTTGFPGATLHLQDDGNLQLIHNGIVRWSSKTGKI